MGLPGPAAANARACVLLLLQAMLEQKQRLCCPRISGHIRRCRRRRCQLRSSPCTCASSSSMAAGAAAMAAAFTLQQRRSSPPSCSLRLCSRPLRMRGPLLLAWRHRRRGLPALAAVRARARAATRSSSSSINGVAIDCIWNYEQSFCNAGCNAGYIVPSTYTATVKQPVHEEPYGTPSAQLAVAVLPEQLRHQKQEVCWCRRHVLGLASLSGLLATSAPPLLFLQAYELALLVAGGAAGSATGGRHCGIGFGSSGS
jgi:hypothetical protein